MKKMMSALRRVRSLYSGIRHKKAEADSKTLRVKIHPMSCALCALLGIILFGCASACEIRYCNRHLTQLESQQVYLTKQVQELKTAVEQIAQSVNGLKFDLDIMRKEVLRLGEHAGTGPFTSEPRAEVDKLTNQLRSETYTPEQIIKQAGQLGRPAFMALIALLRDPDFKVRTRTETILSSGQLPIQELKPLLFEALKNTELRVSVVRILGNLKDQSVSPVLAEYINEKSPPELNFVISESLVKLKDKRGIPRLIEYLKSEDAVQRAIAFDCLTKSTGLTFDYKPYALESEREKAAKLWEGWWLKNGVSFEWK